jgi:type I restriction enzyme S subunit
MDVLSVTLSPIGASQKKLPVGWNWMKLDEICQITLGQSPPASTYRNFPGGLPFFQGKADFGPIHPAVTTWCVEPKKIAEHGDILISVRAPVGPTNLADVQCCIGRGLASLRFNSSIDTNFMLSALKFFEAGISSIGTGSTFPAITGQQLRSLQFPIPPLQEQKRIAGILNRADAAKRAAEEQLDATQALMQVSLNEAFVKCLSGDWLIKPLGDCVELMPRRSMSTHGDATVSNVTSECLSELGFLSNGLKQGVMNSDDVRVITVTPKEILVNRSNTVRLVGRASMFPSGLESNFPIVASDLTIRISPDMKFLIPEFLLRYLSFKFMTGYWRNLAKGTNVSMAKITRRQLLALDTPVPALSEQISIGNMFDSIEDIGISIASRIKDIEALQSSLLRKAFAGEL